MLHTEAATAPYSRDRHGAARAVAYLMLAAAPFVLLTGVVVPNEPGVVALVAALLTFAALLVVGMVSLRRPALLPDAFWIVVPFLAVATIAALNVVSADASTGAQLFFLWPVLYAATFLSRRVVVGVLLAVSAGEAAVVFPVLEPGAAVYDAAAMIIALSMAALVVVTLRERRDQLLTVLETQAMADPLTGLPNRRSFDRDLAHADAWARRSGGPLSLLTVDLDNFKSINDTWGHAVGDLALQAVARAMLSVVRETDVVGRLGGDEFVVLLRSDRRGALRAAAALREAVAATLGVPGGPPTLSIGLAVLPDDAATVDALLAASDAALYQAKVGGRDRVATAGPAIGAVPASEKSVRPR